MFRGWVQNQYEKIGFSQGNVALNNETSRKQNLGSQVKLEQGLRDGNKVKDSIKTKSRYVVEHVYLSNQLLNRTFRLTSNQSSLLLRTRFRALTGIHCK